mmetsp:Transcript_16499/g.46091  ORF Transcript_16499/g.46091 Transcript_16499/m.46091 type:complete len:522 (-) Transcript_16499:3481-5046(-)
MDASSSFGMAVKSSCDVDCQSSLPPNWSPVGWSSFVEASPPAGSGGEMSALSQSSDSARSMPSDATTLPSMATFMAAICSSGIADAWNDALFAVLALDFFCIILLGGAAMAGALLMYASPGGGGALAPNSTGASCRCCSSAIFALLVCSSSCFVFSPSMTSSTAFTCTFTFSTLAASEAPALPSKDSKSDGTWYSMKSLMRSCVSWISFVRASLGSPSSVSSCGLICTMQTPNTDDSSCMLRNAFAKRCCSGESDLMASLNSLAVGISSRRSGIRTSSLFWMMMASLGFSLLGPAMLPMIRMKAENWRARAVSSKFLLLSPKRCCTQPCSDMLPPSSSVVAAFSGISSGRTASTLRQSVSIGSIFPSASGPSMLRRPSGWWSGRRIAWQNGCGAGLRNLALWYRMNWSRSCGPTVLPMADTNWVLSISSMYAMLHAYCCLMTPTCLQSMTMVASEADTSRSSCLAGNASSRLAVDSSMDLICSFSNLLMSAVDISGEGLEGALPSAVAVVVAVVVVSSLSC